MKELLFAEATRLYGEVMGHDYSSPTVYNDFNKVINELIENDWLDEWKATLEC